MNGEKEEEKKKHVIIGLDRQYLLHPAYWNMHSNLNDGIYVLSLRFTFTFFFSRSICSVVIFFKILNNEKALTSAASIHLLTYNGIAYKWFTDTQ